MGNQISRPSLTPLEQEFYHQVKDTLVGVKFKFSKGLLKRFVNWIFKCFLDTKSHFVHLDTLWDKMVRKLNVLQFEGDISVVKFFPLYKLIIRALEGICSGKDDKGEVREPQLKTSSPLPSPSLNPLPYLRVSWRMFPATSCQVGISPGHPPTLLLPFPGWYWPYHSGSSPQFPSYALIPKFAPSTS